MTSSHHLQHRMTTITDADGNLTTIERDAGGKATAIVAPGGQRTTLTIEANGYLAASHEEEVITKKGSGLDVDN